MARNLTHIRVAGFKSIREMELELGDLNVLIGANGAGKSNFVALFTMLGQMVDDRLQLFVTRSGGPDALLRNGRRHTDKIKVDVRFGLNRYEVEFSATQANELMFEIERCSYYGEGYAKPYDVRLGRGHTETRLPEMAPKDKVARHVLDRMKTWRAYHFHDTSPEARVKQKGNVDDNAFLRGDAANLAAFLFLLQKTHAARYRQIVETVRRVAPFFEDFELRPQPINGGQSIQLEWRAKGTDAFFNAHALSDGTLRFICLATLLLQPELPSVIVIDEPELGLHPYAINLLATMLRIAAKKTRVILSTQSVTLVDQFDPEHLVIVDQDVAGSTFRRLPPEEVASWLDDYSLGELWEKNVLGGRPH